jgi:hypothetical protein
LISNSSLASHADSSSGRRRVRDRVVLIPLPLGRGFGLSHIGRPSCKIIFMELCLWAVAFNALKLTLRPNPDPRQVKQPRTGVPARPTLMQLRTEAQKACPPWVKTIQGMQPVTGSPFEVCEACAWTPNSVNIFSILWVGELSPIFISHPKTRTNSHGSTCLASQLA